MAKNIPVVSELWVQDPAQGEIRLDTAAWFAWLEMAERFSYPVFDPVQGYIAGFMTVRKERRQRGGSYWTAYRRSGAQVRKVYVGKSATVTRARLEAIAAQLRVQ